MGLLDSVGGLFKEAGDSIAHAAGNGYKAAGDTWNAAVEDAKATANVVATTVRDSDAKKEQFGSWIDSKEKQLENKVDEGRAWLREKGGVAGQVASAQIGLVEGVGTSLYDAGKGLVQLADGAQSLTNPLEWAANPGANIARLKSGVQTVETLGKIANLAQPTSWITDPKGNAKLAGALWHSAATSFEKDPSKFIGNAAGTIGTMFIPGGEAGAVGDVGKAVAITEDVGKAAAITGDVGKAVAVTADVGKATAVTADVGKAAAVTADVGKATAVTGDVGKAAAVTEDVGKAAAVTGDAGKAAAVTGDDASVEAFQKMLHEEGVVGNVEPAGDLIQLGPHGRASANRAGLGVSGADVQSAHVAPQGFMKQAPNYNPDHALTRLMQRTNHTGMDHLWKREFDAMRDARRAAGQPTTATVQQVHDVIASAIDRAPGLPPGEKQSLIARLSDEVFMESGFTPTDVVEIPRGFKR